jgi:hypothetical protein
MENEFKKTMEIKAINVEEISIEESEKSDEFLTNRINVENPEDI